MSELLVSVVCTNYNKGEWIGEALESFVGQKTDFDFEILVIDDGSSDNSPDVISQLAEKYPSKIRTFYNEKNLGITRTWIKVCKEAKGKYIARCDGDDYWIDDKKLQKQVDLLEKTKSSKWCSTDYNIISPEGAITHRSAFESGLVDRSKSYAEMLATKGFTMSSTWLVDAKLMKEINSRISTSAIDDTFNIQLELFIKTKLSYLPEPTVVYRMHEGSDSRPTSIESIKKRHRQLLETQLEYIDKYKNFEYAEIIRILLKRNYQQEMWATERLEILRKQEKLIEYNEQKNRELDLKLNVIRESLIYKYSSVILRRLKSIYRLPIKLKKRIERPTGNYWYQMYLKRAEKSRKGLDWQIKEKIASFKYKPLISIIVPTYNTDLRHLKELIQSVISQSYDNWELVLIDDNSTKNSVRSLIKDESRKDNRIIYEFLKSNKRISGATNEGIKRSSGEFIALLDHDDIIDKDALFEVVSVLNKNKNLEFIYTDEDKISEDSKKRLEPFFKPDWNPDFLHSVNYITHFSIIKRDLLDTIGYENSAYDGAQDWELFLRIIDKVKPGRVCHIPKILYSWRVHDESTAKSYASKPYIFEAQQKAINKDLHSKGHKGFLVMQDPEYTGQWKVIYNVSNLPSQDKEFVVSNDSRISNLPTDKQWQILGHVFRSEIGLVQIDIPNNKELANRVLMLINTDNNLIKKIVSKHGLMNHIYKTTSYNIGKINSGVVVVDSAKLEKLGFTKSDLSDLGKVSDKMLKAGYRNIYVPSIG